MTNILNIGNTALNAAQVGLSTAGHNIANASVPGFNRQQVIQGTAGAQNLGFGYVGQGTGVRTIQRVYNDFLNTQVVASQSAKTALDTYYTQISGVDNILADPTAGLSPALQGFFNGIADLSANPNMAASRQSALSSAQTLAARFQSLNGQLADSRANVNAHITSSVTSINAYAQQVAQLNDAIQKASVGGQPPNDLMDQRDQAIADLNKQVKAIVTKQSGGGYDISIGSGQPLVMGTQTFALTTVGAVNDPSRLQVGYKTQTGTVVRLPENYLAGGTLAGLFDYRSQTLDVAQNELGRVAITLASDVNAQHAQGVDQNGNRGGAFFTVGTPVVTANSGNTVADPNIGGAMIQASISDTAALTTSNYSVQFTGGQYIVTRLSDGFVNPQPPAPAPSLPQTMDGVVFRVDPSQPAPIDGDRFLVKPTIAGAQGFSVAITDTTKIAAAGKPGNPVLSAIGSKNTGTGTVNVTGVGAGYDLQKGETLEFKYDASTVPPNLNVTYQPTGTVEASIPYVDGATINRHGINFAISGMPADGDTFVLRPNNNVGDNTNALALGALQTDMTRINGSTSYQGAYSQLVSFIGNKTHELDVNRTAEGNQLKAAQAAQQAESGVNLDEEAANIMRYQQAYQAAAKLMQAASQMFDTLLTLGH